MLIAGITIVSLIYIDELSSYPKAAVVREIDYDSGLVLCEDFTGNLWGFYGAENWKTNDVCIHIFNSRQEIIDAHDCGHLESEVENAN